MPLWKFIPYFCAALLIGLGAAALVLHWTGVDQESIASGMWFGLLMAAVLLYGEIRERLEKASRPTEDGARRKPRALRVATGFFEYVIVVGAIFVLWNGVAYFWIAVGGLGGLVVTGVVGAVVARRARERQLLTSPRIE